MTTRARNAVLVVFAGNGFMFATWASRVPDFKAILSLTPGQLSLLLLAISAGSVLGLPMAGRLNHQVGTANGVRLGLGIGAPGVALSAIIVQEHGPLWLAAIGLFLLGLGIGIADVSQNLEGTIVERAMGKAIMPWFHAAFSFGTVAGAVTGAIATYLAVPVGIHVSVVAGLILVALCVATTRFTPRSADGDGDDMAQDSDRSARSDMRTAWLEPRTLLIGVLVLAAAFAEGSANDWMAVGFVDGHHVSKALGVVAFSTFLIFMTLGRVLGTRLLDRCGRVPVLRVLFAMAVAGCALVVFGNTWLAFVGAAIWGVGASLGFPVGMSAAADDPRRAAMRLSTVSTIGYLAFLAGPPALGFLGDHFGILHALLVVGAVSILAILIVPVAQPLEVDPTRSTPAPGPRPGLSRVPDAGDGQPPHPPREQARRTQ
ncbi:MFS transporter [Jongsikchunia kroppenstedtii]|uniref:MFS transporter n=1 Tax=Jongsikchunia kroppenstedtii TaxID=1121721 RepID=UPI0003666C92|nr:MFS transporter [Jongsikchunia kroppenstedtii]